MDFALLPPEVNSARMYTGPGAGSLLAAAGGWDSLAAELATTAEAYGSVLSGLAALHWRGPAAESMAVTAAPYIGWLYTTAEKTQQTAIQARAAALAFEQAYAMTLPPPVVAANRIQLLALIATNFFGQNTAAIAATEAQYAEMWAQDAAAMYGYATASAAAALLTPFSPPRQTTNPAGLTAQAAAVSQATDPLSLLIETVTQALQALTIPSFIPEDFTFLDAIFAGYATVGVTQDVESFVAGTIGAESNLGLLNVGDENPAEVTPGDFGIGELVSATSPGGGVSASGAGGAGTREHGARGVGRANSIGQCRRAGPRPHRPVSALSPAGLTTLPGTDVAEHGMPGVPGVPVAAGRASGVLPRYGVRLTVMAHPPAAG
ncbi:PPE family protein [Mycobacterium tuberculosis CAS/NITR204]|uniref:PPE family protein n=1 Tax=Mycobacterium tuberculosis CAS/NITR204 TaxID=1310114 RepID=R4MKU8_MYCTX|nr:PPE family protein [Mycobacterium tuberculosis CAS/NITR204]